MKTAATTLRNYCKQYNHSFRDKDETEIIDLMKIYGQQVAEQALNDAADRIKLGDTVTAIQKSIRSTAIKLP